MGISGYQWKFGATKDTTIEQVCTWANQYGITRSRYKSLEADIFIDFDKCIQFDLGTSMCKSHWSVFQDHIKYIHNDILKSFRVGTLQYAERVMRCMT